MRLILIRHPQTQANVSRIIYGRTESDYSEAGKAMIPWIVDQLREQKVDAVYASPLKRTRVLAEAIAQEHGGLPVNLDERLVEMHFGIFENMSTKDAKKQYETEYNGFLADFNEYVIPEGESFRQVQERAAAFISHMADLYGGHGEEAPEKAWEDYTEEDLKEEKNREKTVVIVSHSMVIHAALAHMLKIQLGDIWHIKVEPGTVVNVVYQWDFAMLEELRPPQIGK